MSRTITLLGIMNILKVQLNITECSFLFLLSKSSLQLNAAFQYHVFFNNVIVLVAAEIIVALNHIVNVIVDFYVNIMLHRVMRISHCLQIIYRSNFKKIFGLISILFPKLKFLVCFLYMTTFRSVCIIAISLKLVCGIKPNVCFIANPKQHFR